MMGTQFYLSNKKAVWILAFLAFTSQILTHTSLQVYNIHMFLMHVPYFFSLFLFQPTNAQIYVTTPYLYTRYTHKCFDITVSSSGSLKNLCLTKLHKFLKLRLLKSQFHKIIRLMYIKCKIY